MKKIKYILPLLLPIFICILPFLIFSSGGVDSTTPSDPSAILSAQVESYRIHVLEIAEKYDLEEYVDLILSVMQQESGGQGLDPMQSSEGPFNKLYPQIPNGITDPIYSIECGIQELKDCLRRAHVENPQDEMRIKVALAGYNFGNGYIEWCQKNHDGIWSLENAQQFSNMMKDKLGWQAYGDPPYADKVMKYYLNLIGGSAGADMAPMGKEKYLALIKEAEKYLGYPYVFGGSSPATSFDCSGFICWVFTQSGVFNLPRTTAQGIYEQCIRITEEDAKPGDLIFFTGTYDCPDPVSHIGIYVGNNRMLHCGDPISYVSLDDYWKSHFYSFGRLVGGSENEK